MTIIEQLEAARAQIKMMESQIAALTKPASATTTSHQPKSLRDQLNAMPEGKPKELFKRQNWTALLREQGWK